MAADATRSAPTPSSTTDDRVVVVGPIDPCAPASTPGRTGSSRPAVATSAHDAAPFRESDTRRPRAGAASHTSVATARKAESAR